MRALAPLSFALALAACSPATRSPREALDDAAAHVRTSGDEHDAAEREAYANALAHATVRRTWRAEIGSATAPARVRLVEEGGALRVDAGVLGVPSLDTPVEAIRALHRSLALELTSGLATVLTTSEGDPWLDERTRYFEGTADAEALDIRVEGDIATATTPLGDEIVLLREGGEWRVESVAASLPDSP